MKKKRFIKLVMSCGIQRNEAVRIAKGVKTYGTYNTLYEIYRIQRAFRPEILAMRRLGKAFHEAAESQFQLYKAMHVGIDFASGPDQTVIGHRPYGFGLTPKTMIYDELATEYGNLQVMTKAEHEAAHIR